MPTTPTILGIADLHGDLPHIPDCDALLIAGDICPDFFIERQTATRVYVDNGEQRQAKWLDNEFRAWGEALEARGIQIVYVAGNHDYVFEKSFLIPDGLPGTYLRDDPHALHFPDAHDGGGEYSLRLWGTPWVPNLQRWAFYARDEALALRASIIPEGLDVLIAHGPPYGILDQVAGGESVGEQQMLAELDRISPTLYLCGHIHEGRGLDHRGNTTFINAAHYDEYYDPDTVRGTVDLTRYIYG